MKSLKLYFLGLIMSSALMSQDLCPPAFVDALFYNEKIELSWAQTTSLGTVLFDECFASCSLAIEAMDVVHDSTICGQCSGGWFRYSDGTAVDCGSGMYPCEDGGSDGDIYDGLYSAYAAYSGVDSTTDAYAPVDSRLITSTVDLTNYTAAYLEFIEAYLYPYDASHHNLIEVSADGGVTWDSVAVSNSDSVGYDYWFNSVDLSSYVGGEVKIAFRYYCTFGYGEGWFVDDVRVWGANEGEGDLCGTFQHYNVFMDGTLIGTADASGEYTVEGLENGTEYCFQVTAVYDEGESDTSATVCATPMGPFQVNPQVFNFDELMEGEYVEQAFTVQNYDTVDYDFTITSVELSNIETGLDLVTASMDGDFGGFANDGVDEEFVIGDPADLAMTYLPIPIPEDGGQVAYYNDDEAGDDPFNPASPMLISNAAFSGNDPSFLMFDLYFPNPSGPCGEDQATYADDFKVKVSIDDGVTWMLVDSTMETGYPCCWSSYMYNLEPWISEASSFRVGLQYTDCGGEWGYGAAVDNVAIKMGDSFTWLTVSPYKATAQYGGGYNDSITVKVGVYGTYDGLVTEEELLLEATGEIQLSLLVGVGVQVSLDDSGITPLEFALHQNYPNPFNPETNIRFDVAEKSDVSISIFNIVGQKVATLVDGSMEPGVYTIKWNGLNDKGSALPSGMYFYEMKSTAYHSVMKLVLVK